MHSVRYKLSELFIAFVLFPVSFALDYAIWLKMILGLFGFIYVCFILLRVEKKRFHIAKGIHWKLFFKRICIQGLIIAMITTVYVYLVDPSNLFIVVKTKPLLWLVILFVYSVFSVYPQELIYRTFFFERYQTLFKSKELFMFINALLFSLAHLFFKNSLVIVLTIAGGLLFVYTYNKTRSTLLVTIEHAIYGSWLFTVGMGDMLGFPS